MQRAAKERTLSRDLLRDGTVLSPSLSDGTVTVPLNFSSCILFKLSDRLTSPSPAKRDLLFPRSRQTEQHLQTVFAFKMVMQKQSCLNASTSVPFSSF